MAGWVYGMVWYGMHTATGQMYKYIFHPTSPLTPQYSVQSLEFIVYMVPTVPTIPTIAPNLIVTFLYPLSDCEYLLQVWYGTTWYHHHHYHFYD
jgi:hypothetical protein